MLNRRGRSGHSFLVPDFIAKAFNFLQFSIIGCEFVINGFYYGEICSLYTHFDKNFYHELMSNLSDALFCIYCDDHVDFTFYFVDVVSHIDFFLFKKKCLFLTRGYFAILSWFLPYINMNQSWVYICPLLFELPSHLPPKLTPLGCHRRLDLHSMHHKANSHRLFYMVMCMFQYYSLNSSHPLILLLSPQVCSLCLSLLCCPT